MIQLPFDRLRPGALEESLSPAGREYAMPFCSISGSPLRQDRARGIERKIVATLKEGNHIPVRTRGIMHLWRALYGRTKKSRLQAAPTSNTIRVVSRT